MKTFNYIVSSVLLLVFAYYLITLVFINPHQFEDNAVAHAFLSTASFFGGVLFLCFGMLEEKQEEVERLMFNRKH